MTKGRVLSINGGNYEVLLEDNTTIVARCGGKLRNYKMSKDSTFTEKKNKLSSKIETKNIKLSPKAGDIVVLEDNMISSIEPRKNSLIRPDVANIDRILLVFAAKEPTFNYYLLDLFLVNILRENIRPVIVISKIDLCSDSELLELKEGLSYYENTLGFDVFYVNSKKDYPSDLIELLGHGITVVAGQTGAGKSTLINAMIPGFNLKTDEISQALGRGKHTTRVVNLYHFKDGFLGDTPGFSKLDLHNITKYNLKDYYSEFNNYHCKFNDCLHQENSHGCDVLSHIDDGIKKTRYENYIKMLKSLEK